MDRAAVGGCSDASDQESTEIATVDAEHAEPDAKRRRIIQRVESDEVLALGIPGSSCTRSSLVML